MILWMNLVHMVLAELPTEITNDEQSESVDWSVVPGDVLEAQSASWSEPIGTRMKFITEGFLGKPYLLNGIGELQEPDPDPLVRYDAFDCLTFVEEALSLSLGRTPAAVDRIRKDLRYGDGPVTYENRNHFMVSQWIPNAIEKGISKTLTIR